MARSRVGKTWEEIAAVVTELRPDLCRALGRPATTKQLEALERTIGRRLPAPLRQSLAIRNGVRDLPRARRLFENQRMLSAAEIGSTWKMMESFLERDLF